MTLLARKTWTDLASFVLTTYRKFNHRRRGDIFSVNLSGHRSIRVSGCYELGTTLVRSTEPQPIFRRFLISFFRRLICRKYDNAELSHRKMTSMLFLVSAAMLSVNQTQTRTSLKHIELESIPDKHAASRKFLNRVLVSKN